MTSLLVNHILQTEKWTSPELFKTKNRIYTFLNPVSYLIALENKSLFEQFDGIFADGSLLVSAIRLVYGKRVTRRSFDMTSLAPELLNYLMESRKTLYIVASGQEQDALFCSLGSRTSGVFCEDISRAVSGVTHCRVQKWIFLFGC